MSLSISAAEWVNAAQRLDTAIKSAVWQERERKGEQRERRLLLGYEQVVTWYARETKMEASEKLSGDAGLRYWRKIFSVDLFCQPFLHIVNFEQLVLFSVYSWTLIWYSVCDCSKWFCLLWFCQYLRWKSKFHFTAREISVVISEMWEAIITLPMSS